MAKRSTKTVGAMLPILAAVTGWLIIARPWENLIARAHPLCGACGLDETENAWLIDGARHTTLLLGRESGAVLPAVRTACRPVEKLTCDPGGETSAPIASLPEPPGRLDLLTARLVMFVWASSCFELS